MLFVGVGVRWVLTVFRAFLPLQLLLNDITFSESRLVLGMMILLAIFVKNICTVTLCD